MPTSKRMRLGALLCGLCLLSACVSLGGGNDDAPREVQVTSDLVTITGPSGFCVDTTATRNSADTGFVLMGNCAAISGSSRAAQPDISAVLTATIAAAASATLVDNLGALDSLSEEGRALLSRSGEASSVEILDTRTTAGMFLLHARDTSGDGMVGVATDYWRAYLQIGQRLATLQVLALAEADVSDEAALRALTQFAAAVQGANSGANSADLPQDARNETIGPFRTGLFQGIFQ
jgi:phage-related tail fiber protein